MATVDITQHEPDVSPPDPDGSLIDSEDFYEIVDGRKVECPPMGTAENIIPRSDVFSGD